jgi:hypothetical protein
VLWLVVFDRDDEITVQAGDEGMLARTTGMRHHQGCVASTHPTKCRIKYRTYT